jgi:hypothetical protein
VFFRLGEDLLSLFHQVIQHALQLLIGFSFAKGQSTVEGVDERKKDPVSEPFDSFI